MGKVQRAEAPQVDLDALRNHSSLSSIEPDENTQVMTVEGERGIPVKQSAMEAYPDLPRSYSTTGNSKKTMRSVQKESSSAPKSVIEGREEDYYARRAEKLHLLSEAYPAEYTVIKAKIPEEVLHVNLLEMIDYHVIDDINLFTDSYLAEGYAGLEKHFVSERDPAERALK